MALSSSALALRAGTLATTSWRARLRPLSAVLHSATKRARVTTTATGASSGPDAPTPPPSTAGERAAIAADALDAELLAAGVAAPQHPPASHLPRDRLRALRAQSEELAKQKRLPRVLVGAKGLTTSVVASVRETLSGSATGLVRVRLGEGCGLERRSAAAAMERLLDAVCVKQVGFVITLYRDPALATGGERGGAHVAAVAEAKSDGSGKKRRTGSSAAGGDGAKRLKDRGSGGRGSPPPPPPPPAFTVV